MKTSIEKYYENITKKHSKINKKSKRQINRIKKTYSLIKNKKLKILEVGPEIGIAPKKYYKENEIYAIDISKEVVSHLTKIGIKKNNIKILNIDEKKFPFKNETFDIIIAGEIIEHLFFPEKLIKECKRVLKKGGTFIGSTPNAFNIRVRIATLIGHSNIYWNNQHIRFFNYKILNKLLRKHFKKIKIYGINGFLKNSPFKKLLATILVWECKK